MLLTEICWPVYSLGTRHPIKEDGVLFFSKVLPNNEASLEIIDDTNIPGETLAIRRLTLLNKGVSLFKIKYAIFFLGDLIKMAKPRYWFIDAKGKLFQYKKSIRAKLFFKKIISITKDIGVSYIEVQGHAARYSCLYEPKVEEKYAGLLFFNGVYILYGFFTEQYKTTHRKV